MINGKIHYKWSFSIAMLNYQRVLTIDLINSVERETPAGGSSLRHTFGDESNWARGASVPDKDFSKGKRSRANDWICPMEEE
jgi:hypothetical protein